MVDLKPKFNTEIPPKKNSASSDMVKIKEIPPMAPSYAKLKLSLPFVPVAMKNASGYGITTNTMLIAGQGVGGNLSKDVSAFVGVQGMRSITNNVSEISSDVPIDPLMNRPLESTMSLSTLSLNSAVNYNVIKYHPSSLIDNSFHTSLNVSTSGNMDLLMNRGNGRINASLYEGNQNVAVSLNAYKGRDIVKGDTGYVQTSSQGWAANASLREEIGGGKTLMAQAGVSQNEMTLPKSTQPGAIDYGNGVISSRTYNGSVALIGKTGAVNAFASTMDDNIGNKIRMFGLGYQSGKTSVSGNLTCRASAEESYKCNNVGVNVSHIW